MEQNTTNNKGSFRPPIVVVLGHVDHGKTKLLDAIRNTHVIDKESGGITQHIGAYQTEVHGKLITFLDTPGHEAFSAIRSRGAKIADIAILVIAADESIKPQTKEAIRIIKEAKIPFIVAVNKIDKDGANVQRVKQDLAQEEVLVEDWGGKVPIVEISAKKNQNIESLLEMILLVAELEELNNDITSPAEGVIIEANLDKRCGYVATALVEKGILKIGDWIVVGTQIGKVKSMMDYTGTTIKEAFPSQPVSITGWNGAPDIGRPFKTTSVKKQADEMSADNVTIAPLLKFFIDSPDNNDTAKKTLRVIFKSDVSSSMEAINASVSTIKSDEVGFKVLSYGVGNITEADVKTAMTNGAVVFGFRVNVESSAQGLADKEGIKIATYDVIYELIEEFRRSMGTFLEPETKHNTLGKLRILALFKADGRYQILGGKITSGMLKRGALIDIVKGQSVQKLGKMTQLQQNKEDVQEVREGSEVGLKIELADTNILANEGDILEIYEEEKVNRTL